MARASTYTLLSLDRYAALMGINPAHFGGGTGGDVMAAGSQCNDIWYQYAFQAYDRVSREDLAMAIAGAESDIAEVLGFWPAPTFIDKEMHTYPHHHRVDVRTAGVTPYGFYKAIRAKWGKFIQAGQRGTTLVAQPTVAAGTLAYSDADGDGFSETATVTATTTLTDACEVKVYFGSTSAAPEWEIRPARTKAISGGTFTATFWTWQLVDPDLWEALPTTAGMSAVDMTDTDNLVTTVDVYREYTDFSEESCQFFWEPEVIEQVCTACGGSGCVACTLTVQDGCIHVRNVDAGIVVPALGRYDSTTGEWVSQLASVCREPDIVKIWYWAGDMSNSFLNGTSCDPLSHHYAQAIAWMATARLERPFCSCGALAALAEDLRTDVAMLSERQSFSITPQLLSNPFGTRKGEIMAWQRISKLTKKRAKVAVI